LNGLLKIIDAHVHHSPNDIDFFGEKINHTVLNKALDLPDNNNYWVVKALVSNLECIDTVNHTPGRAPLLNEIEGNLGAIEFCNTSNKFLPLAVCQPGYGKASNIENLLSKNTFYGLKFHSYYLGLNANHVLYNPYIEVAQKYHLPCLFHTANGNSSPELVYDLAKRFPSVPFVLYHSNFESDHVDAIRIVKESIVNKDANLYLELSWVDQKVETDIIVSMIKEVGSQKVLFGTDASLGEYSQFNKLGDFIGNINYLTRIEKIITLIENNFNNDIKAEIINELFYQNSKSLFNILE
jgi:predicted TIM-barrel fold metal-dependent hydrolase